MDSLKIALLEKTGHDHGFEHVLSTHPVLICNNLIYIFFSFTHQGLDLVIP